MTPLDALYAATLPIFAAALLPDKRRFGELTSSVARLFSPPAYRCADVLLHAVSVGEVRVAAAVAHYLLRKGLSTLITATTRRGLQTAAKTGLPFAPAPPDFSCAVNRLLRRVSPKVLVLVELELWPNLVLAAARRCALVIANARMTEAAFARYLAAKPILTPIIKRVDLVLAQNPLYAERFLRLGFERVEAVGNIKYDAAPTPISAEEREAIRQELGVGKGDFVVVGGSTYRVEEEGLLEACRDYIGKGMRVVLAPRQGDHFPQLEEAIRRRGLRFARRSSQPTSEWDVLIVDTVGELVRIYAAADVAFVGGTLFAGKGGHNVIEPAGLGVGVVCGKHYENFKDAVVMLKAAGGLVVVDDAAELKQQLKA
ncbi:MAG: hypothetical protein DRP63_01620, partial [Planctomycetota bacterium]